MGQYRGIVLAYVGQHSAAAMVRESDDYWVNRAFQRFWMAVTPDRFGRFPESCRAAEVPQDVRPQRAARRGPRPPRRVGILAGGRARDNPEPRDAEGAIVGKLAGQELWKAVNRELQDEPERVVAYLSFARDLKPSDIFERHPTLYAGVADVYRVKRNVIERLRAAPRFAPSWSEYPLIDMYRAFSPRNRQCPTRLAPRTTSRQPPLGASSSASIVLATGARRVPARRARCRAAP